MLTIATVIIENFALRFLPSVSFVDLVEDVQRLIAAYLDPISSIALALTCKDHFRKFRKQYIDEGISVKFGKWIGRYASMAQLGWLRELWWSSIRDHASSIVLSAVKRANLSLVQSFKVESLIHNPRSERRIVSNEFICGEVRAESLLFSIGKSGSDKVLELLANKVYLQGPDSVNWFRFGFLEGAAKGGHYKWISRYPVEQWMALSMVRDGFQRGHTELIDGLMSKTFISFTEGTPGMLGILGIPGMRGMLRISDSDLGWKFTDASKLMKMIQYLESKGVDVKNKKAVMAAASLGAVEVLSYLEMKHDGLWTIFGQFELMEIALQMLPWHHVEFFLKFFQMGGGHSSSVSFSTVVASLFKKRELVEASLAAADRYKRESSVLRVLRQLLEFRGLFHKENEFWPCDMNSIAFASYGSWLEICRFAIDHGWTWFIMWALSGLIRKALDWNSLLSILQDVGRSGGKIDFALLISHDSYQFAPGSPVDQFKKAYRGLVLKSALYRTLGESFILLDALKSMGFSETEPAMGFLLSVHEGPRYNLSETKQIFDRVVALFGKPSNKTVCAAFHYFSRKDTPWLRSRHLPIDHTSCVMSKIRDLISTNASRADFVTELTNTIDALARYGQPGNTTLLDKVLHRFAAELNHLTLEDTIRLLRKKGFGWTPMTWLTLFNVYPPSKYAANSSIEFIFRISQYVVLFSKNKSVWAYLKSEGCPYERQVVEKALDESPEISEHAMEKLLKIWL